MQNQGSAGVDLSNNDRFAVCRFNDARTPGTQRLGTVGAGQTAEDFSAKLINNSTWQALNLTLKTTISCATTATSGRRTASTATARTSRRAQNDRPGSAVKKRGSSCAGRGEQGRSRSLRAGRSVVRRSHVPHVRRTHRPEQLLRYEVQRVVYPKAQISWICRMRASSRIRTG